MLAVQGAQEGRSHNDEFHQKQLGPQERLVTLNGSDGQTADRLAQVTAEPHARLAYQAHLLSR